jgi:hypothetical protein
MAASDSLHSLLDYECLLFHCDWLGSDLRVGHFISFRCPLVNTPQLNTRFKWTIELSYEWMIELTNELNWTELSRRSESRPMISRPVCLWIKHPSMADFYYLRQLLVLLMLGALSVWREDASVVYNCCWSSPVQSFSVPSHVTLVTIFYCLRFETSLFVASYNLQGYGGGIRSRLHTGLPSNQLYVSPFITSRRTEYDHHL